jgi:hypothetical protein
MTALGPRRLLVRSLGRDLVRVALFAALGAVCWLALRAALKQGPDAPPFNVLIVGWDGVQRDHLRDCYDRRDPGCPGGLPNVARLSAGRGILPITVTSAATSTIPGWVEILTGYDAATLGIPDNSHYQSAPAGYSLFEKAERFFGASRVVTIFLASKGNHTGGDCAVQPPEPWCAARKRLDVFENDLGANRNVAEKAMEVLRAHRDRPFVAFLHFWDPDHTGHARGENAPEYSAALLELDGWLGRLLDELKALGLEGQTLVYVVSDHGFNEGEKQHTAAPFTALATNDEAVVRGGDRKDIAATILVRLGIGTGAIGTAPPVAGQPLTMVPRGCVREGQAALDYPAAPDCCNGLTRISLARTGEGAACLAATGGSGDRSGYCTRCGDGVCNAPEQHCNCPSDCH